MPFIRSMYLSASESPHDIQGRLNIHVIESNATDIKDEGIQLTFYRPKGILADHDWLKEILVQVIEQL